MIPAFWTTALEALTTEQIADALSEAESIINRTSLALKAQGHPVGRYESGSISGKLLDAFSLIHSGIADIKALG